MVSNYIKGINAESRVVKILIDSGYEILGRRIKTKYGEIDILAFKDNTVVAVEVKQRKTLDIARECLTNRQMHRIAKALQFIIYQHSILNAFGSTINPNISANHGCENSIIENYRIDVVLLDRTGNYKYIINAFSFETDTDF